MAQENDILFSEATVKFIAKYEDKELNGKMMDAVIDAAVGKDGKGDTRKTMVAIAVATSVFLKMCADNAKGDETMTALDYSEPFSEILRFYCMGLDHSEKED